MTDDTLAYSPVVCNCIRPLTLAHIEIRENNLTGFFLLCQNCQKIFMSLQPIDVDLQDKFAGLLRKGCWLDVAQIINHEKFNQQGKFKIFFFEPARAENIGASDGNEI